MIETWMPYAVTGDIGSMDRDDYWRLHDEWETSPASPGVDFLSWLREQVAETLIFVIEDQELQAEEIALESQQAFDMVEHTNHLLNASVGVVRWGS